MHDNVGMVLKRWLRRAPRSLSLVAAGFFLLASPSFGQKTDVSLNLYGAFPMTATGASLQSGSPPLKQTADPSAGFHFGVRHIFSPIFGLEVNYGYNRATQHFTGLSIQNGVVYSHAKPFTIDYVATIPHTFFGVKPFVLGGGGLIFYNISSTSNLPARSEKIPVFEYGIGADFQPAKFPSFMAMRFQYRALVGHAPDYLLPYLATHNLINISEPQVGLVFKF